MAPQAKKIGAEAPKCGFSLKSKWIKLVLRHPATRRKRRRLRVGSSWRPRWSLPLLLLFPGAMAFAAVSLAHATDQQLLD